MINGKPLFPGTNTDSQLDLIFRTLGTPDERIFPTIHDLPLYNPAALRQYPAPESLQVLVPDLDPAGVELLSVRDIRVCVIAWRLIHANR